MKRTWAQIAAEPRACVRCLKTRPAADFPVIGRTGKTSQRGVTRVCMGCLEDEAHALNDSGFRPRIRRDWIEGERRMRLCLGCRTGKPLDDFPMGSGDAKGHRLRVCRSCRVARSQRSRRKQYDREGDAVRAKHAAQARARRKGNAEVKAQEAAARRRWRMKVKADPVRRARLLESERMSRRLKREREGKGPGPPAKGAMTPTGPSFLPAAPLARLIERIADHRRAVDDLPSVSERVGVGIVCEDLGVPSRNYRRWREPGAQVQIGLAEKVLLRAGVEWHEVYSYDDHAAHFLAHEVTA